MLEVASLSVKPHASETRRRQRQKPKANQEVFDLWSAPTKAACAFVFGGGGGVVWFAGLGGLDVKAIEIGRVFRLWEAFGCQQKLQCVGAGGRGEAFFWDLDFRAVWSRTCCTVRLHSSIAGVRPVAPAVAAVAAALNPKPVTPEPL